MESTNNSLILSEYEIHYLIQHYNFQVNKLAQLPISVIRLRDDQRELKESERLNKLSNTDKAFLQKAVYNISSPLKILRAHFCIGDTSITRSLFSIGMDNQIIRTTKIGDNRNLDLLDETNFVTTFKKYLGNTNITKLPISIELSTQTVLVFLAIIDQIKHIRLFATLSKTPSIEIFNSTSILDRLNEAEKENFNWLIIFLEKVFPLRIANSFGEKDILTSFLELETKGFIEKDFDNYYSLTTNGQAIFEALLENISKIAVGISENVEDDIIGHEVVLIIRSINHLLMFDISGKDGVFAYISFDDLDLIIKRMLTKIENNKVQPAKKPIRNLCPSCNKPFEHGQKFCDSCGYKLIKDEKLTCPSCKAKLDVGSKFCDKCGTKNS